MTYEEKLKTIIEDQDNGRPWLGIGEFQITKGGDVIRGTHKLGAVLMYLLDTQGLKASYGDERESRIVGVGIPMNMYKWEYAARDIHWAWHTGEGNNWRAAIDTYFDLLPEQS